MRVLLTGSSGWLSRFLASRLRAAGHVAIGLDIVPGADTHVVGCFTGPWMGSNIESASHSGLMFAVRCEGTADPRLSGRGSN